MVVEVRCLQEEEGVTLFDERVSAEVLGVGADGWLHKWWVSELD